MDQILAVLSSEQLASSLPSGLQHRAFTWDKDRRDREVDVSISISVYMCMYVILGLCVFMCVYVCMCLCIYAFVNMYVAHDSPRLYGP